MLSPKEISARTGFMITAGIDFSTYIHEAIKEAGLPIDEKFNWNSWVKATYFRRMHTKDTSLIEEAVHHVLFHELFEVHILDKMNPDFVPEDVKKKPKAEQVTWFLKYRLGKRLESVARYIQTQYSTGNRSDITSLSLDSNLENHINRSDDEEPDLSQIKEMNTLPQDDEVNSQEELGKLRAEFLSYVQRHKPAQADNVIAVFDAVLGSSTGKFSEVNEDFERNTGRNMAAVRSAYRYFGELMKRFAAANPNTEFEILKLIRSYRDAGSPLPTRAVTASMNGVGDTGKIPDDFYGTNTNTVAVVNDDFGGNMVNHRATRLAANKLAARKLAARKYAKLRLAAKKEDGAKEFDNALVDLGDILVTLVEALGRLRSNLGLAGAEEEASLKEKVAARVNFGKKFAEVVEQAPEDLEEAISQFYDGLGEVADKIEGLADDFGLDLEAEAEEKESEDKKEEKEEEKSEKKSDKKDEKESKEASGGSWYFTDRVDEKTKKAHLIRSISRKLASLSTKELETLL